jgi:type I restriction enzyme S subunit
LRFPEFTGEWEKYRVSDILEFFPTNSLSWDQLEYGAGILYNLHYGLIHKGLPTQIELDKCCLPSIKGEFIPNNYTLCEGGDIAFADASEDTNDVGKVVEFFNCENKNIICGLHTIHGRDKKGLTIKGFKGYAFFSEIFRHQIRRLAQGTKIYSISPKNFHEVYIGIPSKEEQTKIATLLRLLNERIATQNKIIEKLESLIKGLKNRLFSECFANEKLIPLKNISSIISRRDDGKADYPVMMITAEYGFINQKERYDNDNAGSSLAKYTLLKQGELAYNRGSSKSKKYGSVFYLNVPNALIPYVYHSFSINSQSCDAKFYAYLLNSKLLDKELGKIISSTARMDGLLNISKYY